jgi:hypothetical protein
MLRMVLLGLLIPLGVGVLAAMELRTPPRTAVAVVQPLAETTVGISDSHGALAKTDRLEITYAKSETPTQPGLVAPHCKAGRADCQRARPVVFRLGGAKERALRSGNGALGLVWVDVATKESSRPATDKEARTPRSRGRSVVVLYNDTRTHRSLDKDAPVSRQIQRTGVISSRAILGGLHHHYARV